MRQAATSYTLALTLALTPALTLTLTLTLTPILTLTLTLSLIMRQACAAIRHAHRAGVCHRDLRLENVMLQQGAACNVKVSSAHPKPEIRNPEP